MKNYKATNVGAALITALLLVAFVVMTVSLLIDTQKISIKTTEQFIDSTNSYYNALGVEDWALGYFKIQWANQTGSNKADWPKVLPQMLIPGGKIKGRIHDLQGMFNINNIINMLTQIVPIGLHFSRSPGNRIKPVFSGITRHALKN